MFVCIDTPDYNIFMNELARNTDRIDNIDIAWDVAHSAKDKRSVAAAARAVNAARLECDDTKKQGNELEACTVLLQKIMGAYAVYPEAFSRRFASKGTTLSPGSLIELIPEIAKSGLIHSMDGTSTTATERLDNDADAIERATEALLLHPPSQDFMDFYDLGTQQYLGSPQKGYRRSMAASDVVSIERRSHPSEDTIRLATRTIQDMNEVYETGSQSPSVTKFSTAMGMLDVVGLEVPDRDKFIKHVEAMKNSGATTIDGFRDAAFHYLNVAIEDMRATAAQYREIYDAIMSGEAATYKPPDVSEDLET